MKTMEVFYIHTNKGLVKKDIIRRFIVLKRDFVLHESLKKEDKWTVSDYLTGMSICSANTKEYAIRKSKKQILKNKFFDYSNLRQCNSPNFLSAYFATIKSFDKGKNKNWIDGIRFAIYVSDNIG